LPQTLIDRHFERLKERCAEATLLALPSGAGLITIPREPLSAGWSASEVTLRFIAPNGYAVASPDCFWVEPKLTLNGGGVPKNSQHQNPIPETDIVAHWFSWHVEQGKWCANRHDLLAWYGLCQKRLGILE
jgi:Prokaryotic E2 family E